MDKDVNIFEDECVEISVNTEHAEPRGNFAELDHDKMTSFETLVHTALALEDDPRDEHSYAYSDKKMFQESTVKDHCYYHGSKLSAEMKKQSFSDDNFNVSTQKDSFDERFVLPHYRSKDSALDVTGFDTISDKCLSSENIHVKTVDVFTENCILPGVSDPDLSRMSIRNSANISLPRSVPLDITKSPHFNPQAEGIKSNSSTSLGISENDHSYSYNYNLLLEQRRRAWQKIDDKNTTKDIRKSCEESKLKDHSYEHRERRDSLLANVGIKRGRSNDDLLIGFHNLKRKDFKKSPFLDQTYQSVELQRVQSCQQPAKRNETLASSNSESLSTKGDASVDTCINERNSCNNQNVFLLNERKFPKLLLDHTYEEMVDTSAYLPPSKLSKTSKRTGFTVTQFIGERKDDSDHCYGIKKQLPDGCDNNSSDLSDSGTESLNDEEDIEIPASLDKKVHKTMTKWHNEHPYFKTWRSQENS